MKEYIRKFDEYFDETIGLSGISLNRDDLLKGIENRGNTIEIAKVLKKAANGEDITICFFGGSITAGSSSFAPPSDESGIDVKFPREKNDYCNRIADWFRETFGCNVTMYNAGIGATDTQLATHRMSEDVLCYNPDLVINEWAMNDNVNMQQKWTTYESVVRKLLKEGIAVLLYSFCGSKGYSAQEVHIPVAKHYNLPMLSYKGAFFAHPQFEFFSNDGVHPNKLGHPMAALQICHFLNDVFVSSANSPAEPYCIPQLGYYQSVDTYDGAYVARIKDIEDGKHTGIKILDRGSFVPDSESRRHGQREITPYTARFSTSYKPMVFEIESAKSIHILNYKRKDLTDGSYLLRVNGKEIVDESLTSACGHTFDYIWASDRVYYDETPQKLTVEILPTCKVDGDFVSIFALLLV